MAGLASFTTEQINAALTAGIAGKDILDPAGQAVSTAGLDVGSITEGLNNALQAALNIGASIG